MSDGIQRFIEAQKRSYDTALEEIKRGKKRSHWMWYIFPQMKGIGYSSTAQYYGIENRKEAEEYLAHPILGSRLLEISKELLKLESNDPRAVMGEPDNWKLKSCMTLFEIVSNEPVFGQVLDKFFGGEQDKVTVEMLREH